MKYNIYRKFEIFKQYKINDKFLYSKKFKHKFKTVNLFEALIEIHNIPYGINTPEDKISSVLIQSKGTCATKNGLFYLLARQAGLNEIKICIGIYLNNKNEFKPTIFLKFKELIFSLSWNKSDIAINNSIIYYKRINNLKLIKKTYRDQYLHKIEIIHQLN